MRREEGDIKTTYHFNIKNREYKITCTKEYPSDIPTISTNHLNEEQLSNVYGLAKTLVGTPMIYDLLLSCVKQDELDLNLSNTVVVDYELGDVPRIIEEEFYQWIEKNQRKEVKDDKMTGKVIFHTDQLKENVQ